MLLDDLPEDFGLLVNIKCLELRKNEIRELPQSFMDLIKVHTLDLGENLFEQFPIQICSLKMLDELWLDDNQMENLPPDIENLDNLTFLDLSQNFLKSIPDEIRHFSKLSNLYLSDNLISNLPKGVGGLSNLIILNIDKNKLVQLDSNIGKCLNLEEIVLVENALRELPKSIGNLSNLKCLNIDGNRLKHLPPEIGLLEKLNILSLRENDLTSLPPELSSCCELGVLDVTGNNLHSLPYSLTKLNLKGLWITENQAKPLPNFQLDYEPGTGEATLTCFLLPQTKCQSLLQKKNRSISISDDEHNTPFQNVKPQVGDLSNNTTTVQFQMSAEGDIDGYFEKETTLVRQKTPHPKDLKAKAQKLFGNKSNVVQNKTEAISITGVDHFKNEIKQSIDDQTVRNDLSDEVDECGNFREAHTNHIGNVCYDEQPKSNQSSLEQMNILSSEDCIISKTEVIQPKDEDNVKLFSKKKETFICKSSTNAKQTEHSINKNDISFEDIRVISLDPLCISKQMDIVIEHREEKLGFSISGGLESTPYKPNDNGIFFSKVISNGPASRAGLLENDKLLAVNGSSCIQMDHHQVVEKLKIASNEGSSITIRIQREETNGVKKNPEDIEDESNKESPEKHSTPLNVTIGESKSQVTLNYLSPISYMANRPSYLRRKEPGKYT